MPAGISTEQDELKGFSRTVAEIEWLLLILVLIYLVAGGPPVQGRAAIHMALFFFSAFILGLHYVEFYKRESRIKLAIETWVMILFAIAISILLTRTPFGRWLYATGSNERAAQLSGVPVKRVQIRIYVISGLCAGVVGILQVANISSSTADLGTFYELNAIAAVVIGGAALSGGRGTVRGTIIGAFVIGFLANGLVIVGVSPFWQKVITGAVIILAVAVDQIQQIAQRRRNARRAVANAKQASQQTPTRAAGKS